MELWLLLPVLDAVPGRLQPHRQALRKQIHRRHAYLVDKCRSSSQADISLQASGYITSSKLQPISPGRQRQPFGQLVGVYESHNVRNLGAQTQ